MRVNAYIDGFNSTLRNNEITGTMPQNLSVFLDDILECFGLREYLKGGEKEKLSP